MKHLTLICLTILFTLLPHTARGQQGDYEVLPHRPNSFGQIWAAEAGSYVQSENRSGGNRFRLGADLRFGREARYLVGWTLLDVLSSGERAASVGDISRSGGGPTFGYFVVPDRVWLAYTFDIADASGSRVSGAVTTYGHQLAAGYKVWTDGQFGLSVEASYLYLPTVTVPVLDLTTNAGASATYPSAQVFGLGIVFAYDLY